MHYIIGENMVQEYNLIVQEDEDGELYIELPAELLESQGWDENTDLVWSINDDGTFTIRKADDSGNEA